MATNQGYAADGRTPLHNVPGRELLVSAVAFNGAVAEIARLQAQVAELQTDAQRYRHLRNHGAIDFPPKHGSVWVVMYEHPAGSIPSMTGAGHGKQLDANVDAAIAAVGR